MPEPASVSPNPESTASTAAAPPRQFTPLRSEIPTWQAAALGAVCLVVCLVLWWGLTRGETVESRILSPTILPSPQETFRAFPSLWFDAALTRNTWASLRRVVLGFGLSVAIGVPIGVLCGCFRRVAAFFAPVTIVGRNIPIAALIPLTYSLFGIGEFQKIMFIFIACVAFIVSDTATAIGEVSSRFVDTAYTLGASRRQIIMKVLVPLAMPSVFNSARLLFGLAFGYIMLAELIKFPGASGGLGDIINTSNRLGNQRYILLVLMIIPLVALAIDRMLYWVQQQLFPYVYGSDGLLHHALIKVLRAWEDLWSLLFHSRPADSGQGSATDQ
ncbi:MAG: ABC transporter permease [Pirellulaceae bacterium]|jgi:NitT/TauT family transport system permease protein|nr:ABC transporter permease [Pirellulaceae bacterium]